MMDYWHNTQDKKDPRPHWMLIIKSNSNSSIYNNQGKFSKKLLDWLVKNIGERDQDWKIKTQKGLWPPVNNPNNVIERKLIYGGFIIRFKTQDDALTFKLIWDS